MDVHVTHTCAVGITGKISFGFTANTNQNYHRHFKKCKNSEICRKTICRDENIFICNIRTRHFERFKVNQTNTEKYKRSAIPYLQILLNDEENQKRQFKRSIGS